MSRLIAYILLCLFCSACSTTYLLSVHTPPQGTKHSAGLFVFDLNFMHKNKRITCFAELEKNTLNGVSCQNVFGFTIFSSGIDNNHRRTFQTHIPGYKTKDFQYWVDLLNLTLFDNVDLHLYRKIKIRKNSLTTHIFDTKGNSIVIIEGKKVRT